VITVKNHGHEALVVLHSSNFYFREEVPPQHARMFTGFRDGHYVVMPAHRPPSIDPRFDPRGGDPYNRCGSRAFP
jgi:hypothetical protein